MFPGEQSEQLKQGNIPDLTNEYIRGLVDGEGSFTFTTRSSRFDNNRYRIPAFILAMHIRDKSLIIGVKNKLGLKNKVYEFRSPALRTHNKIYKRGKRAMLIVREIGSLKNIIVPLFYNRLKGYKRIQFDSWLEKIGSDEMVSDSYKIIYQLHVSGFYKREIPKRAMFAKFLD